MQPSNPPQSRVTVDWHRMGRENQQDAWIVRSLASVDTTEHEPGGFLGKWVSNLNVLVRRGMSRCNFRKSGTTFNAAICKREQDRFTVETANVGDSQTILLMQEHNGWWSALAVSRQHSFLSRNAPEFDNTVMDSTRPDLRDNRQFWVTDNGYLMKALGGGDARGVNCGGAIGDLSLHPHLRHTPTHTTRQVRIADYRRIYAVTASDGLWNAIQRSTEQDLLTGLTMVAARACNRNQLAKEFKKCVNQNNSGHRWDNTTFVISSPDDCTQGPILQCVMDGHGSNDCCGIHQLARETLDGMIFQHYRPPPPVATEAETKGEEATAQGDQLTTTSTAEAVAAGGTRAAPDDSQPSPVAVDLLCDGERFTFDERPFGYRSANLHPALSSQRREKARQQYEKAQRFRQEAEQREAERQQQEEEAKRQRLEEYQQRLAEERRQKEEELARRTKNLDAFAAKLDFLAEGGDEGDAAAEGQAMLSEIQPNDCLRTALAGRSDREFDDEAAYLEAVWGDFITEYKTKRDEDIEQSICIGSSLVLLVLWLREWLASCCCFAFFEPDPFLCRLRLEKDEVIRGWDEVLNPVAAGSAQEADGPT